MALKSPEKVPILRSFLAALARTVGVALASGAGPVLYKLLGPSVASQWSLGIAMFAGSFILIWFLEYERENLKKW
jgi:hypothetical protein